MVLQIHVSFNIRSQGNDKKTLLGGGTNVHLITIRLPKNLGNDLAKPEIDWTVKWSGDDSGLFPGLESLLTND